MGVALHAERQKNIKMLIFPVRSCIEIAPKKDPTMFTWTILVGV